MLAATFNCGNRTIPNFAQKDEPVAKETISRAPNDEQTDIWISDETGDTGRTFDVTISFEKEHSNFGIIQKSSSLNVQCSFYGDYASVRITPPNLSGDYFVKFGYMNGSTQVVMTTIYVCCGDGHYAASYLSYDDAKASYYRNYVATSSALSYISNRDTFNYKAGYYNAYNPARYNAEKNYSDYISGGRDDVEIEAVRTPSTNPNSSTKLILHANWIDTNGVSHPLSGVRADFILTNQLADSGNVHFTDNQGKYTVTLKQSVASQYSLNKIKCRLASVCKATAVEDRFCQNYPICYSLTSRLQLHTYSKVDYYFNIYAGTSDRADAYEITQIQTVPFNYTNDHAEMLDTVLTRFPAEHTDYHDARHRDYFINVQKEDAGSWDVLNHEYGHYICDKLGLARMDETRYPHDVHTPYDDDYVHLAYSEGLATYLGIASQMYSSSAYNIPGYADEKYDDPFRNLSIDYNQFKPAVTGYSTRIYGERIESSVTSILLKMLDDVERTGDEIMLGHSGMWSILCRLSSDYDPCDSIIKFIDEAINLYCHDAFFNAIKTLKEREDIADYLLPYSNKAEWTIMIYMCVSDVLKYAEYDVEEMLSVPGQPNDINIILEVGGFDSWDPAETSNTYGFRPGRLSRYHIRNKHLILDNVLDDEHNTEMGDQTTFENFLDWGFENYPAKKTGVILWNHGGAIHGCCGDQTELTARETHDAFENSFRKYGIRQRLDFIAYNACMMQLQDVADFNSEYFNYMVGSEEAMIATGFEYEQWIDNLYSNEETFDILSEMVDSFIDNNPWVNQTMSILNLKRMASFKQKFESMANAIKETVQDNYSAFETMVRTSVKGYGNEIFNSKRYSDFTWHWRNHNPSRWFDKLSENEYYFHAFYQYGAVDCYDLVDKLQADSKYSAYSSYFTAVKNAIDSLVVANRIGSQAGESHGVSVTVITPNSYVGIPYSTQNTNFTNWQSIFC